VGLQLPLYGGQRIHGITDNSLREVKAKTGTNIKLQFEESK